MTHELPWRQLFVADRITDPKRRRLPWAARGLLDALEDEYWLAGELPADTDEVARLLGVREADVDLLRTVLDSHFPVLSGRRQHSGLDAELQTARTTHEARVSGGRKGGQRRSQLTAEPKAHLAAQSRAGPEVELQAGPEAVKATATATTRSTGPHACIGRSSQRDKRSGSRNSRETTARTAPPADAGQNGHGGPQLKPAASATVQRFLGKFYPESGERHADVVTQLEATLSTRGAKLDRATRVRADTTEHLDRICASVLTEPPRDADKAIVFVLKRLRDTYLEERAARERADYQPEPPQPRTAGAGPVRVSAALPAVLEAAI